MLRTHIETPLIHQLPIKGRGDGPTGGKDGVIIGVADSNRRILHAQGAEPKAGNSADLADAALRLPSRASGKVDLLGEGQLLDKVLRSGIRVGPGA